MEPCATQSSILLRSGWALQRHHLRTLRSASRKFADTNWSSRNLKLKLKMLLLPPINMKVAQANLLEGKRLAWNGLEGTITVLPEPKLKQAVGFSTNSWHGSKQLGRNYRANIGVATNKPAIQNLNHKGCRNVKQGVVAGFWPHKIRLFHWSWESSSSCNCNRWYALVCHMFWNSHLEGVLCPACSRPLYLFTLDDL